MARKAVHGVSMVPASGFYCHWHGCARNISSLLDTVIVLGSNLYSRLSPPTPRAAPVAPLEAAIQLAYAFAECGPQYITAHVEQGAFPILINALHSTDIAKHQHSYVLLAYFDVTVRYLRIANLQSLDRIASVLTGERGLRHPDLQVRCRAAYCLLRVTEGLEPKAFLLLSHVNTFAG